MSSRRPRRAIAVAVAIVAIAMGALGFVPLFGGPGYESSLGAGLLLAFAAPITAALYTVGAGTESPQRSALSVFGEALGLAATLAAACFATVLLHGLRVGFCDLKAGSESFALGPFAGALIGGAWGVFAGEVARGRSRPRLVAVLLAIAGPLASILFSVGRFYTSPMIFAYDPFVGYFSGTLYDTVIDFSGLSSYRAGSCASLVALTVLAAHLERRDGRLRPRWIGRPELAALGLAATLASVGANAFGDRLGHWQTAGTIAKKLGGRTEGARCTVIHARTQRQADVDRFTRDCDAHVAVLERWFGGAGPARITVFLFESSAQKGSLMGAADTYIAKPWRREVYVQAGAYPHPVLGHELAHVVAGSFGRGPFRVAGELGGLLPDPGLIEGVAVAAEPPEGDLLPREWARAMKDLGLLPKLDRLFTLGFLGQNAGLAYTVSGAFVGWVHDRFGADAMTAWYGGKPLPEVVSVPWAQLEADWHAELDREVIPEPAREVARARFDRPAIFGRRCPHVVDACRGKADHLRSSGDFEGAIAAYRELRALDPHDDSVREAIARTRLREPGHEAQGARELEALSTDAKLSRTARDRVLEDLADLDLAKDRGAEAKARYEALLARTLEEDTRRTLDIKIAASEDPELRPAIVALLIGSPRTHGVGAPDRTLATELLGARVASAPDDGLAPYLLARQFMSSGDYEEAAAQLDLALARPKLLPRVRIEAERVRLVAACATRDGALATRLYAAYAAHPEVSAARRGAARSLVGRCARAAPDESAYPAPGQGEGTGDEVTP